LPGISLVVWRCTIWWYCVIWVARLSLGSRSPTALVLGQLGFTLVSAPVDAALALGGSLASASSPAFASASSRALDFTCSACSTWHMVALLFTTVGLYEVPCVMLETVHLLVLAMPVGVLAGAHGPAVFAIASAPKADPAPGADCAAFHFGQPCLVDALQAPFSLVEVDKLLVSYSTLIRVVDNPGTQATTLCTLVGVADMPLPCATLDVSLCWVGVIMLVSALSRHDTTSRATLSEPPSLCACSRVRNAHQHPGCCGNDG